MKSEFAKRAFPALMFVLSLLVVFAPYAVFATGPLDTPLVPACDQSLNGDPSIRFGGACQLCDLVSLGQNIVQFAVAFSVLVATLMFAYAGVLYFTAASKPDNIKKGHEVFVKTFVGLIIILIAFILVDVIMKTLVQGDPFSGPWQKIQCAAYPFGEHLNQNVQDPTAAARGTINAGNGGSGPPIPFSSASENLKRGMLHDAGVQVNNGGVLNGFQCGNLTFEQYRAAHNGQGCTNVGGLTNATITYVSGLPGRFTSCTGASAITISGGSEAGHQEHNGGEALDISDNCAALNTAVRAFPGGVDPHGGATWVHEGGGEPHWHVCTGATCR